jgi:HAD superfamily hydrolase (TIGR01549 family)
VFWQEFTQLTGWERAELEPFFQRFYDEDFDRLRPYTAVKPSAAALMQTAHDLGLNVVIATNPLFPLIAIEKRLAWAGISADEYDYALVTAYENMHSAKPQPEYYREILSVIGSAPEQAIMVGDDWENDISPAVKAGLSAYWIAAHSVTPPDPEQILGHGSLEAFADLVADGWLDEVDLIR